MGDFESELQFADSARRFEPGLFPLGPIAGLGNSLKKCKKYGWERLFHQIASNRQRLEKISGQSLYKQGAEPLGGGVVSIQITEEQQRKVRGVATHRRGHTRFSVGPFTKKREIQQLKKHIFPYQKVLITGASGGLGEAFAKCLAKKGCELTLMGRSKPRLEKVAEHLPFSRVTLETNPFPQGTFDLIINNAAMAPFSLFDEEEEETVIEAFRTNFHTPWSLMKNALRKRGACINIVTASSRSALPYTSSYNASKRALFSLSESLGRELNDRLIMTYLPPHMPTQTAMHLGRKALGFFSYQKDKQTDPICVAEHAIQMLLKRKRVCIPRATRYKLAINQLFPRFIDRKISKRLILAHK